MDWCWLAELCEIVGASRIRLAASPRLRWIADPARAKRVRSKSVGDASEAKINTGVY